MAALIGKLSTSHKEPPFRTMTTSVIYRKVASKRQLKYDAVKYIFINVMIEAMEQAKHHGMFELASMLRFKMCRARPPTSSGLQLVTVLFPLHQDCVCVCV